MEHSRPSEPKSILSLSRPRKSLLLPILFLLGGLSACSSPPPEPYSSDDLEPVRQAVAVQDWELADDLLDDLERDYFDRLSQGEFSLMAGNVAWELEDWDPAIEHYSEYLLFVGPTTDSRVVEERMFEMGMELLEGRRKAFGIFPDRSRGATLLLNLAAYARNSPISGEALAQVGDYHYKNDYYSDAKEDYQLLVRLHGDSEWIDLATFRIGMCDYLLLDGPHVDGRLIDQSRVQLKNYLQLFPSGLYRDEAETALADLEEMSAEHELLIGEYYATIDNIRGARSHFQEASTRVGTEAAEVALEYLEELPPNPPLETALPPETAVEAAGESP